MKINEYKDSVGSMKLSDSFKQQLKEKMLLEAQNRDETAEHMPDITVSVGKLSKKYSKYAALAACLLLAVSAAGILSASQNAFKMGAKADDSAPENAANIAEDGVDGFFAEDTAESDIDAPENAPAEVQSSPTESGDSLPAPLDNGEDLPAEDPVQGIEEDGSEEESEEIEESDEEIIEDTPVEAEPRTSPNGYSTDPSPDYDGSYYGIDYVVNDVVGSAQYNAVVVGSIDVNAKMISGGANGAAPQAPESVAPNEINPDSPVEDEVNEDTIEDAPVDDDDMLVPEPDNITPYMGYSDGSDGVSFEDLTSGESKKYYDVRDGVIAKLDNVGLIRFNIIEGYDSVEDIAKNSDKLHIDPTCQTLYRIAVTYDYFNSEDANAERLLINTGNTRYQLIGRPAMEGEYIAVVTETEDGVLTPVPELIYAVHNVRGLDIAYHLYSDNGFMIDPGSTNMGIMPEEVAVVNSTANNPEIYTQKAAVRELTFYLRRNILRMEPNVLDFSKPSEREDPESPSEEEAPRELIRAVFPSGKLGLTKLDENLGNVLAEVGNYTSDEVLGLRVNGIGVGDSMEDALGAFFLKKYSFTPNAKLTLCASEEVGGWFVIVTFSENVVSKIEVFE